MQYRRNSEYLTVLCEKWYLHPTLHGNLVCNAGKSFILLQLYLKEGFYWSVYLRFSCKRLLLSTWVMYAIACASQPSSARRDRHRRLDDKIGIARSIQPSSVRRHRRLDDKIAIAHTSQPSSARRHCRLDDKFAIARASQPSSARRHCRRDDRIAFPISPNIYGRINAKVVNRADLKLLAFGHKGSNPLWSNFMTGDCGKAELLKNKYIFVWKFWFFWNGCRKAADSLRQKKCDFFTDFWLRFFYTSWTHTSHTSCVLIFLQILLHWNIYTGAP